MVCQGSRYEGIEDDGYPNIESQQNALIHASLEDDPEQRFEDSMKRIEVQLAIYHPSLIA